MASEVGSSQLAVVPSPQRLNKRVRVRRCLGKLRIPTTSGRAEVVLQCQQNKHDDTVPHEHRGMVFMDNNTFREFSITWSDQGYADLYTQARKDNKKRGNSNRTTSTAGPDRERKAEAQQKP